MRGRWAPEVSSKFRPLCQYKYVHICLAQPGLSTKHHHVFIDGNRASGCIFHLTSAPYWYIIIFTDMTPRKELSAKDAKTQALRTEGTLHPHPEVVQDELFHEHDFFDPRDRVQVKYEMLRRHRVEGKPIAHAAASFGTSRQVFYVAQGAFEAWGLSGLMGRRRGPKRAHKCTAELLDFVEQWRQVPPGEGPKTEVEAVQERFGIALHPRSIDRALARRKKKLHPARKAARP